MIALACVAIVVAVAVASWVAMKRADRRALERDLADLWGASREVGLGARWYSLDEVHEEAEAIRRGQRGA